MVNVDQEMLEKFLLTPLSLSTPRVSLRMNATGNIEKTTSTTDQNSVLAPSMMPCNISLNSLNTGSWIRRMSLEDGQDKFYCLLPNAFLPNWHCMDLNRGPKRIETTGDHLRPLRLEALKYPNSFELWR